MIPIRKISEIPSARRAVANANNVRNVICLRTCHSPLTFTAAKGAPLLTTAAGVVRVDSGVDNALHPWTPGFTDGEIMKFAADEANGD